MTDTLLQNLSGYATAVAAIVAATQLWFVREQARTQFEDQISAQYRAIIRELPVEALLSGELDRESQLAALPAFFHYFDLCNEQAFLWKRKRIRRKTWKEWEEGIVQNFKRPAFHQAWCAVSPRVAESFDELRATLAKAEVYAESLTR